MVGISAEVTEALDRFRAALAREVRVDRLVLFGSHAHGTADRWSDIDVAVISPDLSDPRYAVPLMARLRVQIDPAISPMAFTPAEWQDCGEGSFAREVKRTGIELFGPATG